MTERRLIHVLVAGFCLAFSAVTSAAAVNGAVSISARQDQANWVGQQLTLYLDLKTTGFSFADIHFNLPEVSNAFLMQTDSTTIKLTEKSAGQDWQIIRYPLALFPQRPGRLEIPAIDVRFSSSAGFGTEKQHFQLATEALELVVNLPPGAREDELVITTRSFKLDYEWQPEAGIVRTGDAFTLVVKRRVADISAMLLPPLPQFSTGGLAVYPQTPEVDDRSNRGDLVGERVDSVTWVVEQAGSYSIPGIRFKWWNPQTQQLEQKLVPGITFDAVATSVPGASAAVEAGKATGSFFEHARTALIILIVFLSAAIGWFRFRPRMSGKLEPTEKSAFQELCSACKSNDAAKTYAAIFSWLAFYSQVFAAGSPPVTLSKAARELRNEQFARSLMELQQAIASADNRWLGDELLRILKTIRRNMSSHQAAEAASHLSPLNW
jgi:hypothetical protein